MMQKPEQTTTPHGSRLAFFKTPAAKDDDRPGVVFLGGFMSDMSGVKAAFLEQKCRAEGQEFLRFDYSGHGQSEGRFTDGTIGLWKDDALHMLDTLTEPQKPQILVGSSMGGWIALLLALQKPARVAGLVLLAPAPDFSENHYWKGLTEQQRRELADKGIIHVPSDYGQPYPITKALIEDGRRHLLLTGKISVACPVRILHGKKDTAVPWQQSLKLRDALASRDVTITFIDDGDHRLSREQDLQALWGEVDALSRLAASGGSACALRGSL